MMLYDNACVEFLWRQDRLDHKFNGCQVLIDDNGIAEVTLPFRPPQTVVTHAQNLVVYYDPPDPEAPDNGDINAATIHDYTYCQYCGALVPSDEIHEHCLNSCPYAF